MVRDSLGLTRSDGVWRALLHLEREARQQALADDYDAFYATDRYPVQNGLIAQYGNAFALAGQ